MLPRVQRPRAWAIVAALALLVLGLSAARQQPPTAGPTQATAAPGYGTADSNGTMIAVTGIDITGASILYVIDTERRQLSVYQATGGGKATAGVSWIGARNIDLDLQVDAWNDRSSLTYKKLRAEFDGRPPSDD